MKEILDVLPERIRRKIEDLPKKDLDKLEEIRIRLYRPVELIFSGSPVYLECEAGEEDGMSLLNEISGYSIYAMEEELKRGYITMKGGHRVGLAGKVITENGTVKMIRDVASFNIRIARQKIGTAEPLIPYLYNSRWLNTLIIGPPQTGKTTLLRDLARVVTEGYGSISPQKAGIVDERSEIAGCVSGIPQHRFGTRVDVLDGCPKAEGMMMLIRSMSPDVLIADEIGRKEDMGAVMEAVHAGVQLFVTVHGYHTEDLLHRPFMKELIDARVFDRYVELKRGAAPGAVGAILNEERKNLFLKAGAGSW
ncbi:stage III sporulation protein AA [Metabacillus sp. GX 13764]|uniref:stage III sporulation protein AA n=1 Tax=Metabacillus kandeliae TaxID=2900151 RepID=UPI001E2E6496|nr:stage III sporulation protein AA [Metabacillus kandeliae]MCD7033196.1 stage III sporulation protein AA [Metabacillus kandeliae]